MKAIKILFSIIVALIVVVAIAIVIGLRNLDTLVEAAIESVGPMVTKTDVQVDSVHIELTEGRGEVRGLSVANPEGFSSDPILRVGNVVLDILPRSITEDVVVIEQIIVDGVHLNAEHRDLTRVNLKTMLDQMRPTAQEETPQSTTASPDVRFMVEHVAFTNAQLSLRSDEFGERKLVMRDLELNNLGDRETGLTPAQLTRAALAPLLQNARERAEEEVRSEAEGALKKELEERLSDEDKEKVDKLRSLLGR